MNFLQSFKKCNILTPDSRKQPQTSSELIKKTNEGSTVFGHESELCTQLYGKIFGGIPKMLVLCNFLKILLVSDKIIHRGFRTHATL